MGGGRSLRLTPDRATTDETLQQAHETDPMFHTNASTCLSASRKSIGLYLALGVLACSRASFGAGDGFRGLGEINPPSDPSASQIAIVGARLIDGRGGQPIRDSAVVIRGSIIVAAGKRDKVEIPDGAVIRDASGQTLLPGLVDTHYHNDSAGASTELPTLILSRGVTTIRDPSLPIEDYEPVRLSERPTPRCFLTGRHFDQEPHAHPHDARTIPDSEAARQAVALHLREGASCIKVYFRLPLDLIRVVCSEAHEKGVPVIAHLELVDASDAIEAGLDGIEHVTSLGTSLAGPEEAKAFREAVRRDNSARNDGRYRLWADIDLESDRARRLIDQMVRNRVVLSPTLAVFERQAGDEGVEQYHVRAFQNMMRFVSQCHRAGVPIVVGSHTSVPHAGRGWAYQREMELLLESGMNRADVLIAATMQGARYLGCADRLGSIETGKRADLILVDGDPLVDLQAMRTVRGVLVNGRWVSEATDPAGPDPVRP